LFPSCQTLKSKAHRQECLCYQNARGAPSSTPSSTATPGCVLFVETQPSPARKRCVKPPQPRPHRSVAVFAIPSKVEGSKTVAKVEDRSDILPVKSSCRPPGTPARRRREVFVACARDGACGGDAGPTSPLRRRASRPATPSRYYVSRHSWHMGVRDEVLMPPSSCARPPTAVGLRCLCF
jgi:hypothetical protein